tara:strand:- start:1363 stop:1569 length:207 start_codon:yes stop_codon:yes gene_type:complete
MLTNPELSQNTRRRQVPFLHSAITETPNTLDLKNNIKNIKNKFKPVWDKNRVQSLLFWVGIQPEIICF